MPVEPHPDWPGYRRGVGDRLRDARLRARLSQEGLAHRAGVSRTLVQRTERATGEIPSLEAVFVLARACGVPAHQVLHDDGARGGAADG